MNGRHNEKWADIITFGKKKSMFTTLEEALAYAVKKSPSATNPICVACFDAGIYTPASRTVTDPLGLGTNDVGNSVTVPAYVKLHAPNLSVKGRIYVEKNSYVEVGTIDRENGSGNMYQKACIIAASGDGSSKAVVIAKRLIGTPYIVGGASAAAAVLDASVTVRDSEPLVYDDGVCRENGYRYYMADFGVGSALFDAAATSDSATIFTQPANSELIALKAVLTEKFDSYTSCGLEVGLAGDQDGILDGTIDLVGDALNTAYTTRGAYINTLTGGGYMVVASTDWKAYVASVGTNLDTATVGNVRFFLKIKEIAI